MHNILIVDDESGIRQSLKGVLEDEGYRAAVAGSGEACLETLRKRSFDVVLLDVWLPGWTASKRCTRSAISKTPQKSS
jgi:two-component system nitrogen regulation response regulator NtrX